MRMRIGLGARRRQEALKEQIARHLKAANAEMVERTTADVLACLNRYSNFEVGAEDHQPFMICGYIAVSVRGVLTAVPIVIGLSPNHPFNGPDIMVASSDEFRCMKASPFVDKHGMIKNLAYLNGWSVESSLIGLIEDLEINLVIENKVQQFARKISRRLTKKISVKNKEKMKVDTKKVEKTVSKEADCEQEQENIYEEIEDLKDEDKREEEKNRVLCHAHRDEDEECKEELDEDSEGIDEGDAEKESEEEMDFSDEEEVFEIRNVKDLQELAKCLLFQELAEAILEEEGVYEDEETDNDSSSFSDCDDSEGSEDEDH